MQSISAIILTKNEEQNIKNCLESLKWCDEIVIVDDYSIDKTINIARKYKTTIYSRALNGDFSSQRNFGISKAKSDWVLFVDSDETVSDGLVYEISNAIQLKDRQLNEFDGFFIKRTYFMWRKKLRYGEVGNEWRLRLAKKTVGQWEGKVHERWRIKGLVGKLNNPIFHFPHQTLDEFFKEINFYTDIRAQELHAKKIKVYWWSVIVYPTGKFIVNFFIKRGFLDGVHGLVFAITMSFHSFLVRGKLWLLWRKE